MKYAKIKQQDAQAFLKTHKNNIDFNYKIKKDKNYVYFPLKVELNDVVIVQMEGEKYRNEDHKRIGSFDFLGDSVVVNESPEGDRYIIDYLLTRYKLKNIFKKTHKVDGSYRVRGLKRIYGSSNIVEYKENGIRMRFDITRVFFSPRLAHERERIAKLVKPNEHVLVLFAGVGPFSLLIGKTCPTCVVASIELNPEAVKYFKQNIKLNKLKNVSIIEGDVKEKIHMFNQWADRIIMPLPKDAEYFLKDVESVVKRGTIIHFYTFCSRKNSFNEARNKILKNFSRKIKILNIKKVKEYSPSVDQIVVDFEVVE